MPKKSESAHFYKRREKRKSREVKDWIIILLTLIVVVYALSLASHLTLNKAQGSGTEEPTYLRVQILNGCKQSGLAEKIRDQLISRRWEEFAFDVVDVGNFGDSTISQTLILDRKGQDKRAFEVADILGIKKENVFLKRLEDNYLDIDLSIVLGADYSQIFKN
ncbi:MAG: LytR C-terminal domain-containing protein [candidate division Zixibacteria bacterium]|nr:LytR C-terminal domain-containing protein [candidate division Zixibacteria bacterium]